MYRVRERYREQINWEIDREKKENDGKRERAFVFLTR